MIYKSANNIRIDSIISQLISVDKCFQTWVMGRSFPRSSYAPSRLPLPDLGSTSRRECRGAYQLGLPLQTSPASHHLHIRQLATCDTPKLSPCPSSQRTPPPRRPTKTVSKVSRDSLRWIMLVLFACVSFPSTSLPLCMMSGIFLPCHLPPKLAKVHRSSTIAAKMHRPGTWLPSSPTSKTKFWPRSGSRRVFATVASLVPAAQYAWMRYITERIANDKWAVTAAEKQLRKSLPGLLGKMQEVCSRQALLLRCNIPLASMLKRTPAG